MRPANQDAGRIEAELRRLEPIAASLARRFFIPGWDNEDLRQLARIGIWQAIESWDGVRPLEAFAWSCARRRVLDAVTRENRERRRGDREARSHTAGGPDEPRELLERLPTPIPLEHEVAQRARLRAVVAATDSLTDLERRSLALATNGHPYSGACAQGGKGADNAVQRAREKLRAAADAADAA